MIIKGSQRGGAKQLATHLNNVIDNDHVELHDVRGFVADTLEDAFLESYSISKGTNASQHMFSVSFNPPPGEDVPVDYFEDAFERVEAKFGLSKQPRVVVFHEKEGRRHAHAVWCRIDSETMTAINLPFYKAGLRDISRELFIEHKWKMPKGLMNSEARESNQFTLAELHQAKRTKQDQNELKSMFAECWAVSDSRQSFEAVLKERGFLLAQGDRRGFVAVGFQGELYSLSRYTGIKTEELEDRLGSPSEFPNVEDRRAEIARQYQDVIDQNIETANTQNESKSQELETQRKALRARHRQERQELKKHHQARLLAERQERQRKLAKGLRGVWEAISGKRAKTIREHKWEDQKSIRRDLKERQALITRQLEERGRLQIHLKNARKRRSEEITAALLLSSKKQTHESPAALRVRDNPELLLTMLTEKESTFTHNDMVRQLKAYIPDVHENRLAMNKIMSSDNLVQLHSSHGKSASNPRYSTREMVNLEVSLLKNSIQMAKTRNYRIPDKFINSAVKQENTKLLKSVGVMLSDEQYGAIKHITSHEQLTCVTGVAGAGKSTMLAAARQAWEDAGYRVFGAALAGKAAKGLEQSSGIQSRTLASFELSWENGRHKLGAGDVLVIDEAGMIGSKQLAKFINEAKQNDVKLVLIGDAEQLQAISAGSPFRAISEEIGSATLHNVHRQKQDWQRQASKAFANGNTKSALQTYREHEAVQFYEDDNHAIQSLAQDYMDDFIASGDKVSRLALAHRRADVKILNDTIREMRRECGNLKDEITYDTEHGKRAFAAGDRLLFTKNDRNLGVKNGMLGTITKVRKNLLTVNLDSDDKTDKPQTVTLHTNDYDSINHGYATTIHKSQGATVDRSFILASRTLDRHLTYVAMTRHKRETKLYVDSQEFKNFGQLSNSLSRARHKLSTLDFETSPKHQVTEEIHNIEYNHEHSIS